MSDLQLSLLIIGAMVVGAVYVYNLLQERRFRRRLEQAFGDVPDDVLLRRGGDAGPGGERVEPQLSDAPAPPRAVRSERRHAAPATGAGGPAGAGPAFDAELDYVAEIEADAPLPEAAVEALLSKIAECGKPTRVLGCGSEGGGWEELGRGGRRRYSGLQLAVQLVNRSGCVSAAQLALFCDAVRSCAESAGGYAACPDAQSALKSARELDTFCSGVDVAIGINIIAGEGITFSGTQIRARAEAAGFKLEPDGIFHYRSEERRTLFTLDNHEPAPFLPERLKSLTTRGVTLMLDVPRVADGPAVLDRMLEIGRALAADLGGNLVDDNRAPLSDAGIARIREQLRSIHAALAARGMPAGGERALRLFS